MKRFSRTMVLFLVCALLAGALACNTVKGAGRDIQGGGRAIEGASDGARN